MKIGVGLPAVIPGATGTLILEWARTADAGPFSSLGIIDRVVYPNYEPMVTLAAAAGSTRRIGLMTTVLLAPLRDTAILAKEAASLDALSGGRLTLGMGIGGREDDFVACDVDMHTRGKRFDEQLVTMHRIWSGEQPAASVGPIGPRPAQTGGPRILIGANSPPLWRAWDAGAKATSRGERRRKSPKRGMRQLRRRGTRRVERASPTSREGCISRSVMRPASAGEHTCATITPSPGRWRMPRRRRCPRARGRFKEPSRHTAKRKLTS